MSDVLSPAEQARAAQWAANWLGDHGYDSHRLSGGDAVAALRWAVDELDPPETVESLRAERDEARKTGEPFRRYWLGAPAELDYANDTIARLRATHDKQIEDMKTRWLKDARERSTDLFLAKNPLPSPEAGRGRCQRED